MLFQYLWYVFTVVFKILIINLFSPHNADKLLLDTQERSNYFLVRLHFFAITLLPYSKSFMPMVPSFLRFIYLLCILCSA